ncbi:hypothetical protein C922_04655 [Plasmodium inui San Antonio 1]|uniref:Uncharacterized protein n=1 Tax=Plasmodium inui San Antonio 1 TaxID=1237626 RepID=W7A058_9APIC|nr:hypothetical protein C922_04655 [Plasmodium inui San Antonio 1]EUD64923.1 hypothetical protein C922_04655 [Plasmodium inui San Antonio 1]
MKKGEKTQSKKKERNSQINLETSEEVRNRVKEGVQLRDSTANRAKPTGPENPMINHENGSERKDPGTNSLKQI